MMARSHQFSPYSPPLWQAYQYGQDPGEDLWDFALESDRLYETELTISDLRWLVANGEDVGAIHFSGARMWMTPLTARRAMA